MLTTTCTGRSKAMPTSFKASQEESEDIVDFECVANIIPLDEDDNPRNSLANETTSKSIGQDGVLPVDEKRTSSPCIRPTI